MDEQDEVERLRLILVREQAWHMSDWSEVFYAAGWMDRCEVSIWESDDYIAKHVKRLAVATGVWVVDDADDQGEPVTVPLDQWITDEYPKRKERG